MTTFEGSPTQLLFFN